MSSDLFINIVAPNGVQYRQPTGLFINNEFVSSKAGGKVTSIDPTNDKEIATVYAGAAEDIDAAVAAARAALSHRSWKNLSATKRGYLMWKLAELMEENQRTLATIDTWDNGKPYAESFGVDLDESISTLKYYAGWADKVYGQTISTTHRKLAYTIRQPIGVVGQIIPWNYPLMMAAWKLGPALACGNTVVLKPAEQTPLSILVLAELIKAAGFPPGVVNIVNGRGTEAGTALATHPDVDKIAFTGSTTTGRTVQALAARSLKSVTLETGGKSPLVVFDDADIDQAAKWAHLGIMSNQGQICCGTSRLLVQASVYDAFITRFRDVVRSTSVVGDPFKEDTYQGPQVSKIQHERVLGFIEHGKADGATLLSGGRAVDRPGYFIEPTIFGDVAPTMRIYQEEIFGPVVTITRFEAEADAVALANGTQYGLGAAVFTTNSARSHRMAAEIESGMVWINSSNDSDFRVPFGGVKQSGIGRELGEAGLEAYTQCKAVHVNLGTRL